MPAAAVIHEWQALFLFVWCQGCVGKKIQDIFFFLNIMGVFLDFIVTIKCGKYKGLTYDENKKLHNIDSEA